MREVIERLRREKAAFEENVKRAGDLRAVGKCPVRRGNVLNGPMRSDPILHKT